MNQYIELQIKTHIMSCNNFIKSCHLAALKDDEKIDKIENKIIKQIEKATKEYVKALEKIANC